MPLRGDQRALLQLLCEREQSYADISGLLGGEPDEVRARAREALRNLGGADPDAEIGLTDFLLGQADPIGRADAVRYLGSHVETLELAHRLEEGLREIAPNATLPRLPEPRGKRTKASAPVAGETSPENRPNESPGSRGGSSAGLMSTRQSRMIAALGALAVVLLLGILAIAGVFSSGNDDSTTQAPAATTSADGSTTTSTSGAASQITTVKLAPVNGSGIAGSAKFGLVDNSQLYVDLSLQGLPPAPEAGSTFLAWLMVGDSGGYPINNPVDSPIAPDQNGNYSGRIAVPSAVALTVGGQATAVRISSSPIRDVSLAAKQAAKQQAPILSFIG
ncbi:MAG: hypothetical protein H0V25_02650, partial [Solirubrobacterales bacterium]|nr:hypothetical protein [Solirubrobacterales bacterium]